MVCVRSSLVRLIDRGVAEITGCEANPKGLVWFVYGAVSSG